MSSAWQLDAQLLRHHVLDPEVLVLRQQARNLLRVLLGQASLPVVADHLRDLRLGGVADLLPLLGQLSQRELLLRRLDEEGAEARRDAVRREAGGSHREDASAGKVCADAAQDSRDHHEQAVEPPRDDLVHVLARDLQHWRRVVRVGCEQAGVAGALVGGAHAMRLLPVGVRHLRATDVEPGVAAGAYEDEQHPGKHQGGDRDALRPSRDCVRPVDR
mmetsp:Transcript_36941/g.105073  ORF Transcript_36941/g.105073 Transcript_36941/m.105073 type:complete len:217 (-) Transcript_36941:66-716(-)